jgi:hypothetical protein
MGMDVRRGRCFGIIIWVILMFSSKIFKILIFFV